MLGDASKSPGSGCIDDEAGRWGALWMKEFGDTGCVGVWDGAWETTEAVTLAKKETERSKEGDLVVADAPLRGTWESR